MKSLIAPLLLLAMIAAAPAPSPAPTYDPHSYDDEAMHFQAPADYLLGGRQAVDSTKLDKSTVVAVWAKFPGQANQRTITISVEPYDGKDVKGYEVFTENELRGQIDGVFIGSKAPMTLVNGMPAYFLSITSGSGFDAVKIYEVIWFDGLRGVAISIRGRLGEITETEAKTALHDASAVRFPMGRL